MLDENLPTFYLKLTTDLAKQNASIHLSQGGESEPVYTLRRPDPGLPGSKNRYAVALYDSFNPDILFGEVLLIPDWTKPSPTPEELRLNGGVPPAPQPILPTEFTIQLYNPDQQVLVRQHPGSWNSAAYWEFEMPQQTFRQPSASSLDRTQNDPTASDTTPKINFKWKKDGKLSKDLICQLSGKSTNADGSKRRHKEPDITISLFRGFKELTLYEPNLYRVEMEDPKGLEVVLLLSATVVRDVYYGQMRETFNITEAPRRNSSGTAARRQAPSSSAAAPPPSQMPPQMPSRQTRTSSAQDFAVQQNASSHAPMPPLQTQSSNPRPPPIDARSQWELDVETARLKKQVEIEERDRKHIERKEEKRVRKMLETEEREARRKQAEIDKETERLRKQYAEEQRRPSQQKSKPQPPPRPQSAQPQAYHGFWPPNQYQQPPPPNGPYLQPNLAQNTFASAGYWNPPPVEPNDGRKLNSKMSIFSLGRNSNVSQQRLQKKKSAVF